MNLGDNPLCAESNPDFWFPEPPPRVTRHGLLAQEAIRNGAMALAICSVCPLIKACTEYTFQSIDSINYGISAGLTPYEKRKMINYLSKDISSGIWITIREEATAAGVVPPPMPKRKKPEQFYKINDTKVLNEQSEE